MTKAELMAYASSNGIDGVNSSMNKAKIREIIEENLDGTNVD